MAISMAYFLVLYAPAAADLPLAARLLPVFILGAVVLGLTRSPRCDPSTRRRRSSPLYPPSWT